MLKVPIYQRSAKKKLLIEENLLCHSPWISIANNCHSTVHPRSCVFAHRVCVQFIPTYCFYPIATQHFSFLFIISEIIHENNDIMVIKKTSFMEVSGNRFFESVDIGQEFQRTTHEWSGMHFWLLYLLYRYFQYHIFCQLRWSKVQCWIFSIHNIFSIFMFLRRIKILCMCEAFGVCIPLFSLSLNFLSCQFFFFNFWKNCCFW